MMEWQDNPALPSSVSVPCPPRRADTFPGARRAVQRDTAKTSIPSKETSKMDTLEAIRTRRSIRQYLDKPVPQDVLQQVLASAMYAPSACNQQPWQP
jgi:hypothetical protein